MLEINLNRSIQVIRFTDSFNLLSSSEWHQGKVEEENHKTTGTDKGTLLSNLLSLLNAKVNGSGSDQHSTSLWKLIAFLRGWDKFDDA